MIAIHLLVSIQRSLRIGSGDLRIEEQLDPPCSVVWFSFKAST
jgi:hypothetical protein